MFHSLIFQDRRKPQYLAEKSSYIVHIDNDLVKG
jgi:hypothetical protein